MIRFKVNGNEKTFDGDPDMPLLWYLRDVAGLTGTKFGCGMALCGACTVHQNGAAIALLHQLLDTSRPDGYESIFGEGKEGVDADQDHDCGQLPGQPDRVEAHSTMRVRIHNSTVFVGT